MYIPPAFDEARIDVMHHFVRTHPLATLVIACANGFDAHHLPLHLDAQRGAYGMLQGHVARANVLLKQRVHALDAIAIFHGPDAYITPSWYASKRESGKAVPTWNYVAVHAHARLRVIDDTAWLRAHLETLVSTHEAREAAPWKISDAPADYITSQLNGIVGIELDIVRLEGKWKASQNHPAANRAGVVDGLRQRGTSSASAMADIVQERSPQ